MEDDNLEVEAHLFSSHEGEADFSHVDDVLNEKLERAFHKQTSQLSLHEVAKIASEHDPVDLAYAVTHLPSRARGVVFENLPDDEARIIFLNNTTHNTRATIFRGISDSELAHLIEGMPADDAVEVLEDVSDRRIRRLLARISTTKSRRIRALLSHERTSAGRLMTDEFFAFPLTTTIGEVAGRIRNNPGIDLARSIFVLDEDGELAGYVPVRNLIVNPPYSPLKRVMQPVYHTVYPESSRDEAVDLVERYSLGTLPVIDHNGKLVGVIDQETALEASEDIADETIATIAGTGEDVSEHDPIWKRFLWRAPWLAVTLLAGMFTSTVMSSYSGAVWFSFVPFFVPMIAGMSGNVGLQCSTVLVRGMATGELAPGSRVAAIGKEISIGFCIGITFGMLCGLMVYFLNVTGLQQTGGDPVILGFMVSMGLFGACLSASILGTLSPFFFVRIGVDPAVSSGPIVTAFNDVSSTIMFLFISHFLYVLLH